MSGESAYGVGGASGHVGVRRESVDLRRQYPVAPNGPLGELRRQCGELNQLVDVQEERLDAVLSATGGSARCVGGEVLCRGTLIGFGCSLWPLCSALVSVKDGSVGESEVAVDEAAKIGVGPIGVGHSRAQDFVAASIGGKGSPTLRRLSDLVAGADQNFGCA